MNEVWPLTTTHVPGDPGLTTDVNQIASNVNALKAALPYGADGAVTDGAVAAIVNDTTSQTSAALNEALDARQATLVATSGDQTARINTFLSGGGARRLVGSFSIDGTITVPSGVYLDLTAAEITPTVADSTALTIAAGASVYQGKITSANTWDATNVAWTNADAKVLITGDGVAINGLTIENVYKVGIGARDVSDVRISNCRIRGGLPDSAFTGTETVHFGIGLDPGSTDPGGDYVITGNLIDGCVQGVFLGNYGAGQVGRGLTIVGNTFYRCLNHGCYLDAGVGHVVTGNNFNRCQIPIVASGSYHVVSGNTLTTGGSGAGEDVTGISIRDAVGCVVSNNTIQGEASAGTTVLDVSELTGVVCTDNIIEGNVIKIATTAAATGIRVGRGTATTYSNNIVRGNIVSAPGGGTNLGTVSMFASSSAASPAGCEISSNVITITGASNGIYVSNIKTLRIIGNDVRLAADSGSAVTLGLVYLNAVTGALIASNQLRVGSSYGLNVALRGVWEAGASGTNYIERNRHSYDPTRITSATPLVLVANGGDLIDETLAGAPTVSAAVGSVWKRTDGGAATTFYVKESGTGSTGWVGK